MLKKAFSTKYVRRLLVNRIIVHAKNILLLMNAAIDLRFDILAGNCVKDGCCCLRIMCPILALLKSLSRFIAIETSYTKYQTFI